MIKVRFAFNLQIKLLKDRRFLPDFRNEALITTYLKDLVSYLAKTDLAPK